MGDRSWVIPLIMPDSPPNGNRPNAALRFKGQHKGLPRPSRKRGGKAVKRGLSEEQIPVIVARDRTGATLDAVLPRLDAGSLPAALGGVMAPSTDFCCDGGSAITAFARRAKLNIHALPRAGQSAARGAGISHQQRERLPWPTEGMAPAFPRRRHQ